jgi:hypothetical protein
LKQSSQQIQRREAKRRFRRDRVRGSWNRPPLFPNMVPRSGVATISPKGVTLFSSGMAR